MALVRFNHGNCMPEQSEYTFPHDLMNWFWNDYSKDFKNTAVPMANIVETKEEFRIELSVPGFSKSDFTVKLDGQLLNISGTAAQSSEEKEESYVRREFSNTAFSRSFRLSNWVDSNNISARYENGLLLVTIPKVEEAKANPAKQIEIQ